MKRFFLQLMVLMASIAVATNGASAQNIRNFKHSLGMRSQQGAKVGVVEDRSTYNAVVAVEAQRQGKSSVLGFRVVLFYDDAQYAEERANEIMEELKKDYPEINSYLVYEKPYFKVSVGDCLTEEEAIMMRNMFIDKYTGAFIRRDNITLKELSNVRRRADCLELDVSVRDSLLRYKDFRDEMRKDETMYIVMQRDSALRCVLQLDDLNNEYDNDRIQTTEDPAWVTEW